MRVPVQCKHGVVKKYCPDCNARLDKIIDFVRNEGKPMTDQVIEVAHSAQELREMYESLKCCGNCFSSGGNDCPYYDTHWSFPFKDKCCEAWIFDTLTNADRKDKLKEDTTK